ncbi:hypothetical protein [Amycolatopsis sp. NBC_01480]|uniref:hypothetical protein n=1 Tax=Amycolatopsis sp. NBC_01480 TaxID=2903562 RepID=UPI002E29DC42|nr:hypothetical protein [Amycolatopsis sp. NBC_01480]
MTISIEAAETSEAQTLLDFETRAPAGIRAALGISHARIGGGVVLAMRNDPISSWSKAMGFGFNAPVTIELIEEIGEFYRAQGAPSREVLLAPAVLPEDWPEICARTGLREGVRRAKLACPVETMEQRGVLPTRVQVGLVSEQDAGEWGTTLVRGYGAPVEELAGLFTALVGRPGWSAFAGRIEGRIVSTGALFVRGETGQCFGGATLAEARSLGGQSALLAARIRAAQEAGCRWLVAETVAEEPGSHNPSLHNMLRLGFEVVYERSSWMFSVDRDGQ